MRHPMPHPFTPDYRPELATPRAVPAVVDLARALLRDLRGAWDVYVANVAVPRLAQHGERIVCAAGCAACCHWLVLVPRFAGVVLAAELAARGDEAARQRVYDHAAALAPALDGAATLAQAVQAVAARRVPCPLLVDARCSVYAARPVVCSGLLALDVACALDGSAAPARVIDHRILGPAEQAADALFAARVGVPAGPLPLSYAVVEGDALLERVAAAPGYEVPRELGT